MYKVKLNNPEEAVKLCDTLQEAGYSAMVENSTIFTDDTPFNILKTKAPKSSIEGKENMLKQLFEMAENKTINLSINKKEIEIKATSDMFEITIGHLTTLHPKTIRMLFAILKSL